MSIQGEADLGRVVAELPSLQTSSDFVPEGADLVGDTKRAGDNN